MASAAGKVVGNDNLPTTTVCLRGGAVVAHDFELARLSDHAAVEGNLVWVHLDSPRPEVLEQLSAELDLHPLAVEDVLHERQRPKVDRYGDQLFINSYATALDPAGRLLTSEISAFVLPSALITVQMDDDIPLRGLRRRLDRNSGAGLGSVGSLLHFLLDYVVDTHLDVAHALERSVQDLAGNLFDDADDEATQRRVFDVRMDLMNFHRVAGPTGDVVRSLLRFHPSLAQLGLEPYYRDVLDHATRAAEQSTFSQDMLASIHQTSVALSGNQTNTTMKKITSWAAIIAVPASITGYYGMNVPYPGSEEQWGVFAASGLIVVLCLLLYTTFRRRKWL